MTNGRIVRRNTDGEGVRRFVGSVVFNNVPIVVDGATGVGWGTAVIGGLGIGNILFNGAVAYVKVSTTASSGITATFDGDYAIGTAATANADVSGTNEANIIPSTALGAATAKVSPVVRGVSTTTLAGAVIDNTDGSLKLNLNLLIDDATISADDVAMTLDGVIHLDYTVLGDD